jgi:hypothetical protein
LPALELAAPAALLRPARLLRRPLAAAACLIAWRRRRAPAPPPQVCFRLASQGYARSRVEAALCALQNDAHAFTTCDDEHWKGTA